MVRKTFLDLLETLQNSDLNARLKQQYQPFKALIREDTQVKSVCTHSKH